MEPLGIARRLAELGKKPEACRAYGVALGQQGLSPREQFEAASYIFFAEGDYKIAFTAFVSLYNQGHFQSELMELMTQGFYLPNVQRQQKRYERNCRALAAYPYCFRKEFPAFESLPVRFYPFDNKGYIPYFKAENRFGEYLNFDDPVVDRYFFRDLEKPVLARDVYSQYQLEYLNDNVRKSEWVGRENHIYLHYGDFSHFCAYLQCLELRPLLREEKLVFLFGEEIAQYPIDFKERFGVDYSLYPLKPVGIREVQKLIWHTQLASHNGGDFFNEIFYGHPNLLSLESVMFDSYQNMIRKARDDFKENPLQNDVCRQLAQLKNPTDKDYLVALFLSNSVTRSGLDPASRIAPALIFQPHFHNIGYTLEPSADEAACALSCPQYEEIKKFPVFREFKYIKTFTPIRRPTTSHAATVRFMVPQLDSPEKVLRIPDEVTVRVLNRSYLREPGDRLYRDSILVRFEDGKLNPKATFPRLAEFLDLPYTESMTYCSSYQGMNPESYKGNARGFDPAPVYRTYDEYANDAERAFLEYFMSDIYAACGYAFQYYKGEPVDEAWAEEKIDRFSTLDGWIAWSMRDAFQKKREKGEWKHPEEADEAIIAAWLENCRKNRLRIARLLLKRPRFVTHQGQPLQMIPVLQPDPDLLEQPLYR